MRRFFFFLVFAGLLQACSVSVIRFDKNKLPYILKDVSSDSCILEAPSCAYEDVVGMLSLSKVDLSKMTSVYRKKNMDVVIIVDSGSPKGSQRGLQWVRLPLGNEFHESQFDDAAKTVSMLIGFDNQPLDGIIGQCTNISPVDKTPFFFAQEETLPRTTGIVNVDQVTCYLSTALHCLYQVPAFRESIRAFAKNPPKGTVNIVSLVDLVYTDMAKGVVPDEKLMRAVVNALAKDHPVLLNAEKKLTIAETHEGIKFILASLRKCMTGSSVIESPIDELFNLRTNEVFSDLPGFSIYDIAELLGQSKLDMNELVLSQLENVDHLPPYLFVSMPRFFGFRIETPLDFPVDSWTLFGPRLDPTISYTYDLAAIVIHVRSKVASNNGGHYVIVVRQGQHWVYLNDDKIPVRIDFEAEKELLQTEGNLFMYKRQGVEFSDINVPVESEKFPVEPIVLSVPEEVDDFPYHLIEGDFIPSDLKRPIQAVQNEENKPVRSVKEKNKPRKVKSINTNDKKPGENLAETVASSDQSTVSSSEKPGLEAQEPMKEHNVGDSTGLATRSAKSNDVVHTISENTAPIAAALAITAVIGYFWGNQ